MKTLEAACKAKCEAAFEVAIKNCLYMDRAEKKKKVKISNVDSNALYDFYISHVQNDREQAFLAIGRASRKAAAPNNALLSVLVFLLALMFVLIVMFKSVWPLIAMFLTAGLLLYLFWKRRRTAQKIWAGRKAFKNGTEEALEKMCQVLAMSPHRVASLPLIGGLIAAIAVAVYQTVVAIC